MYKYVADAEYACDLFFISEQLLFKHSECYPANAHGSLFHYNTANAQSQM